MNEAPIEHHVSVYSSGRSDEIPMKTKLLEYPINEPFIGHVFEAKQLPEIKEVPLDVERRHVGYYEHLPITRDEEKKHGTLEKLTHLFKKEESRDTYPQVSGMK